MIPIIIKNKRFLNLQNTKELLKTHAIIAKKTKYKKYK
ncbi:hypothetical protein BOM_0100 [Borrelia miyamotoi FR64b]|nr:hypothetical protein BOM_0100 [Borrelia miyamotoi FR64b]